MNEENVRTTDGVVDYIADLKELKKGFMSKGLKLDGKDQWFNVTGFKTEEIAAILGETKKGDTVRITESKRGQYWNVVQIKHIEKVGGEVTEVERPLTESVPKAEPVEVNDLEVLETLGKNTQQLVEKLSEKGVYIPFEVVFNYLYDKRK